MNGRCTFSCVSLRPWKGSEQWQGVAFREADRMVKIVSMTIADFDSVLPLFREMHFESKYAHQVLEEFVLRNALRRFGDDLTGFLAMDGASPVGFCCAALQGFVFRRGSVAVDLGIFVKKTHRHTRAFLLLMRSFETWARSKGAVAMICGITAPHDVDMAKRAYKKLGFVEIGVNMQKDL